MQVFHSIDEAQGHLAGWALCLGNFDGVHLGHQALFETARALAKPAAMTFWPHPGKVLQPELAPKLIVPLERRLQLMDEVGVEAVVVQAFTREFAALSAEDFERALFDRLRVSHVVVGADFTYGAKRAGTVETLQSAAAGRSANVKVVPAVTIDGVVASSSKIREYLLEGRVSAARRLLGRGFDLEGVVVPGQGRGRKISIPTANVDTQNEVRPAAGVYAVRVKFLDAGPGGGPDTEWRAGAANIGVKPTFGGTEVTIEVHLLDFSGDVYGRHMRVEFLERLRGEQRFGSIEELVGQIRRDMEEARTVFARL